MAEPWWLVARDVAGKARERSKQCARRCGRKRSFRGIKDARNGRGLYCRRINSAEWRHLLSLLAARALAPLTLLGAASVALGYDRWLRANMAKTCTHSLLRGGQMLYELLANMPEQRLRPLMQRFGELVLAQSGFTRMFGFMGVLWGSVEV